MAKKSLILRLLYKLYKLRRGRLRSAIRNIVSKLEGGAVYSPTLREIFKEYHDVEIGMYTHGGCFVPYQFGRFTSIGRYCSIARSARAFTRNHPMEWKSTHALFFNPVFKYCAEDTVGYTPLHIGNDVWIGENALIMPNVTEIGDGAVVAAGAIVNKNVLPYAVVVGNPGRVVRFRFREEIKDELLNSKWWDKDIAEIEPNIADFQQAFENVCLSGKGTMKDEARIEP